MNYNETLNYIHSLGAFSHKAGLDRITKVCSKLGNPQDDFKCIHIAGTNGKGSVNTFVSSALKAAGYKVGAFVSPYIVDFCERIQINGEYISRDDLCQLSKQVIDTGVALTEFEFITAVGFLYDRGLLSLEEKLTDILCDELPEKYNKIWDSITLDMLLTHRVPLFEGFLDIDCLDATEFGEDYLSYILNAPLRE